MSNRTKARLVRDIIVTDGMSGKAVTETESVDVLITWPAGLPETEPNIPYAVYGQWRIADVRGGVVENES